MMQFFKSIFITKRCFFAITGVIVLYVFAFFYPVIMWVAFIASMLLLAAIFMDVLLLYLKLKPIVATRITPDKLSNGDDNVIKLLVKSNYAFFINIKIADEMPVQFQARDVFIKQGFKAQEKKTIEYSVRPVSRGEYVFGVIQFFITTYLGLIERRYEVEAENIVPCYPSFLQLKKFQLMAATNKLAELGVKQIRKIGHSMEFENIKEYVIGDDYRIINWKAAARRGGTLMVNNYTDERSQPVYCIINSGRVMKMPFDGLTLLDYAINASLVLSNISLIKQDKAGLITYGDKWLNILPAERNAHQMSLILAQLYKLQTNFLESNIEKLYATISNKITHRSLLIYFTNYENMQSVERDLNYLRMLNKSHLLLVVFFQNTELKTIAEEGAHSVERVYRKIVAEKFMYEKRLIVKELQKHGILSILTTPENLTVNVINKYLEIKVRQMM